MRPFFVFQNFGNGSHNPLGQTVPTSKGNLKKFSVAFRLIRGQESRRKVLVLKPEIFMAIGGADDGAGGGTAAIRFRRGKPCRSDCLGVFPLIRLSIR